MTRNVSAAGRTTRHALRAAMHRLGTQFNVLA